MAFYAAFVMGLQFTFGEMTLLGFQVSFTNDTIPTQILVFSVLIPFMHLFPTWLIVFVALENIINLIFPFKLSLTILGSFLGLLFLWNSMVQLKFTKWKNVIISTIIQMLITITIFLGLARIIYNYFPDKITRT
ncbi:MAG: hypothetical protein ACJATA_000179 [Sphingobacteriales bacterium]|jgi:hypothetical protein